MNGNMIYQMIEQFAKEYTRKDDGLTVYHILYGCARLLCMDQNTLNAIFSDEAQQQELKKILELFDANDIDYTLMRDGMPILLLCRKATEQEQADAKQLLRRQEVSSEGEYAFGIMKAIISEEIPEMTLMKKNHTLESIIAYADRLTGRQPAPAQESSRQSEDGTEKPSAAEPSGSTSETAAMTESGIPEKESDEASSADRDKDPAKEPADPLSQVMAALAGKPSKADDADGQSAPKQPSDTDPKRPEQQPSGSEPQQQEPASLLEGLQISADEVAAVQSALMGTSAAVGRQGTTASAQTQETVTGQEPASEAVQMSPEDNRDNFQILISRTKKLYSDLLGKVKGQDEAIRIFVEGYFQAEVFKAGKRDAGKPSATFLFAGPPGVGKTYLSETAASLLGLPFARFDMSEYTDPTSTQIFAGSDRNYKSAKPGKVTTFVREHPKCVVLFDEIEKANISVIYLFLQILDAGTLTDSYDEKAVSFKDTILIFTTNVGRALYESDRDTNLSVLPRSVIMDALSTEKDQYGRERFPAAICSRFSAGNVVMLNHLGVHFLVDIVNDRFRWCAEQLKEEYGYQLVIDPMVALVLLFNQSSGLDARTASSQSVIMIKNELYEFGRHVENSDNIFRQLEKIHFKVQVPKDKQDIRDLLINKSHLNILILTDDAPEAFGSVKEKEYELHFAADMDSAMETIRSQEIDFIVIDPACGRRDLACSYLSMDDWDTEGIRFFEEIRHKLPQMPVYLIEKEKVDTEDKSTFLQRGARGFIPAAEKILFVKELKRLCDILYLQQRANELSSRGRVLSYNTAQTLSEDGKSAEIIFYDFRIRTAVKAGEQGNMIAENERPTEKFADVIGAENAKDELMHFVSYLKDPKSFALNGEKPPKGILLYGPPGTGKTMLARAMAGESDVSFFPATASGFQRSLVGEGEKAIRDLFAMAKRYAPSIIFIDEIDAIGKERVGSTSTHYTEGLLNTLLTEMDGFETNVKKPVFVLAATNYDLDGTQSGKQSAIDPALLRRFDNRILVDLPKEEERKKYLTLCLEKKKITTVSDAAVSNVAARTTGESLAILQNVLGLAIRNASKKQVPLDDSLLLNALEEYMYGEKHDWNEEYYREVATHESGHAYISWLSGVKPSFVTIVSRGDFGGYMQSANSEKTPNYTKRDLLWRIRTSLAGRASEIVFFGEEKGVNTGVSSDLQHATNYAMNMICRYGMGSSFFVSMDPKTLLNSPMGASLMKDTEEILTREMETTQKLIAEGKSYIEKLSNFLLKNNQAMENEIEEIFESVKKESNAQ
ncbi:MAG: AAA family ATPase [Lachnospiraceae bacterium]|nr:AAA family ATPase [Lachnospiraceae bacterium]